MAGIRTPRPIAELQEVASAEPILGSWKSYRARLRLDGSGQIHLNFDRHRVQTIDRLGSQQTPKRIARLAGTYQARDDLLLITWDDGSKLNYRWRIHRGELLLTDHTGQMSRLKRLLD